MESYENILIGTIAVAILCISFSTWITLSDLRSVVSEPGGKYASGRGSDLSFTSRAIEHIENPLLKHQKHTAFGAGSTRSEAQLAKSWGQCYVQNHTECVPFIKTPLRVGACPLQIVHMPFAVIVAKL